MYLDGLDELDKNIVRLLIENARISYSDIGEKIGIKKGLSRNIRPSSIRRKSAERFPVILR